MADEWEPILELARGVERAARAMTLDVDAATRLAAAVLDFNERLLGGDLRVLRRGIVVEPPTAPPPPAGSSSRSRPFEDTCAGPAPASMGRR